jgi:hypothetical protein
MANGGSDMATYFKNPANGYVEIVSGAGILCFLFGPLYFLLKGVWVHALLSLILAIPTVGVSWLLYPFFAHDIVETSYLRRGWIREERESDQTDDPIATTENDAPNNNPWRTEKKNRVHPYVLLIASVLIGTLLYMFFLTRNTPTADPQANASVAP